MKEIKNIPDQFILRGLVANDVTLEKDPSRGMIYVGDPYVPDFPIKSSWVTMGSVVMGTSGRAKFGMASGWDIIPMESSIHEEPEPIIFWDRTSYLTLEYGGKKLLQIDSRFEKLFNSFEKSKYILEVKDDFDDEGSKGYDFDTWFKVIQLLNQLNNTSSKHLGKGISVPRIYHSNNSSIDVLWKYPDFQLLLNVKPDNNKATYYGKNQFGNQEGTFDISTIEQNRGILLFLSIITLSNVPD